MFKKIKDYILVAKLRSLYSKHERWLIPGSLFLGFIIDVITFASVSFDFTIIILSIYLVLAALSIVLINFYEDGLIRGKVFSIIRLAAPLIIQFAFGGLFSSFVVFYSFSGSLIVSWPFIGVLIFLMIANEIFKKYHIRPDIQLAVYFFALFSFFNLAIPYLTRTLGAGVFIFSSILSFVITGAFIWGLSRYSARVRGARRVVSVSSILIFMAMQFFYFTNLIPPIPLVARDMGVYYYIERIGNEYRVLDRERSLIERLLNNFYIFGHEYQVYGSREAYFFSSIFAPPRMNLEIVHEWQFRDPESGWVTRNTISFPISGGRTEGFRGFSRVSQVEPGRWRVNVKTKREGQIIVSYIFKVEETSQPPEYIFGTR